MVLFFLNNVVSFSNFFFDASVESQLTFQRPATKIMEQITDLHHDILSLLIFLCVFVFYLLFVIIYKFNSSNLKTKRDFFFKSQATLEIFWTVIPMLIVISLLYPSFALLYGMDELIDPVITVKVLGHQWYWSYDVATRILENNSELFLTFDSYMLQTDDLPFGGFRLLEVDNRLKVPVNSVMRFLITSTDVLHSWAVPSFGVKVDACPGRLNQVCLFIERLGVFYGQCSEICGVNHGFMPIVVESVLLNSFIKGLNVA